MKFIVQQAILCHKKGERVYMRPVIPTMLNGIFLLMKKKVIIQNEVNQNNDIFPADFLF